MGYVLNTLQFIINIIKETPNFSKSCIFEKYFDEPFRY